MEKLFKTLRKSSIKKKLLDRMYSYPYSIGIISPTLGSLRVSDGYAMFAVLWFFAMIAANISY